MKKLWSRFLVVEQKYGPFCCDFFVKFLKTAAYGNSGMFWGSFGEKSNSLIVFGPRAKVAIFWQKISAGCQSAFHVSSAKLWEKMIKVIFSIMISFGTFNEFFLILAKKNSQVCWNSNLSVQRKNVKKTVEQLVFRLFWILTRKTCVFAGKFLAVLSKILSTCPVEHLQSNNSEWKSWRLEDFRICFEIFGTMAANLFRGRQNSNRCPREKFMDFFFSKEKNSLFFRFRANVYFQRKFLPELRNPQSTSPWKFSGKKHIFWNIYNV